MYKNKKKISNKVWYERSYNAIKCRGNGRTYWKENSKAMNSYNYYEISTGDKHQFKVEITEENLEKEVVALVREKIGAVACLRNIVVVKRLPKTRSGKILRKLIRTMLDGKEFQIPSTIDDETIITELEEKFLEYQK